MLIITQYIIMYIRVHVKKKCAITHIFNLIFAFRQFIMESEMKKHETGRNDP